MPGLKITEVVTSHQCWPLRKAGRRREQAAGQTGHGQGAATLPRTNAVRNGTATLGAEVIKLGRRSVPRLRKAQVGSEDLDLKATLGGAYRLTVRNRYWCGTASRNGYCCSSARRLVPSAKCSENSLQPQLRATKGKAVRAGSLGPNRGLLSVLVCRSHRFSMKSASCH